jgi:hypothetical protein
MEKKVIVTIPAQKAKKVEKVIHLCDLCGKKTTYFRYCTLCKRLTCDGTFRDEHCTRYDPNCIGDYPDPYCLICDDLKFNKYKAEYEEIDIQYEEMKTELDNKVREESLKHEQTD